MPANKGAYYRFISVITCHTLLFGCQDTPLTIMERLHGLEPRFITHLVALLYPVSKIKVRLFTPFSLFNLPENSKGAQTAALLSWIEYGVDCREPIIKNIDCCQSHQFSVFTHFKEPGIRGAFYQKGNKLFPGGWVHVTVFVAKFDIVGIEPIVAFSEGGRHQSAFQVTVFFHDPALVAIRVKVIHVHSHRDACVACFTVGAIIMCAAAPKAQCGQLAVELFVDVGARVNKHGCRFAIRKIAAVVGWCCIEHQSSQTTHLCLRPVPLPVECPVALVRFFFRMLTDYR